MNSPEVGVYNVKFACFLLHTNTCLLLSTLGGGRGGRTGHCVCLISKLHCLHSLSLCPPHADLHANQTPAKFALPPSYGFDWNRGFGGGGGGGEEG